MSNNETVNPLAGWPRWAGYLTTLLAVAIVTTILDSIESIFPLGRFPIPYVLLVMASAYLFGEGPAALTFVLGLVAYSYFFILPAHTFKVPADIMGWAALTAFLLGMTIVAFSMLQIRRSQGRIRLLLDTLSQSNRHVTDILESITDAFFALDRDWRFSYVNQEAEQLLQHGRDELMGSVLWDVFPEAVGSVFDTEYHRAMSLQAPVGFEAFYPPFDTWFEVRAYPTVEGLSVYFHDITERVGLHEALELQVTQLQRALLPEDPSIGGGYRIAASYVPGMTGAEIGGDFYDVFETETGETAVIIGDVSGKGIPAAAQAAATRGALRAFAYDMSSPSEAMSHTNAVLYQHQLNTESFVTAMAVFMNLPTGRISYANAAHPPAAVYRFASGEVEFFPFGQAPFGILETQQFENHECVLDPGDRMVLYTDGVSEARRGGDMFGSDGIEAVLKEYGERSAQEIIDALLSSARDWAQGHLTDDIAIIVVERPRPEGFPWPPVEGSSVSLPHVAKGA